ncbi:MAG: 30S ribosome-binding factor RbfA [Clostridia bacterium]|nr:30S ribosome-binding factor RbfA [Clostridia bacterium]MBQ7224606.1 30S ribosome-binding factor RbfA [Clostridia bacterium]
MSYRSDRLNSEMRKVIADVINNKIKNPRKTEMVSVMSVEVAKDLKTAKVYLSIFGNKDRIDSTFQAVKDAAGFIRKELSTAFRDIRQVPSLEFRMDTSMQYSSKIESILEEIKNGDAN